MAGKQLPDRVALQVKGNDFPGLRVCRRRRETRVCSEAPCTGGVGSSGESRKTVSALVTPLVLSDN
jgi:hypothetical protein